VSEILLLLLDPLLIDHKLSFFFSHLVSELLEHSNLFASLFVHELGLLTHTGVITGIRLGTAKGTWLGFLEVIN